MSGIERVVREYRFRLARTQEDRDRVFALRYEVFNRELEYRLSEDRVRQLEKDEHDEVADLCFIEHIRTRTMVGCVRLVVPDEEKGEGFEHLPIEHHCGNGLLDSLSSIGNLSRRYLCEVSRLAIHRRFRSRKVTGETTGEVPHDPDGEVGDRMIGVSLFLASTAMVGLTGRHHVLAFMEPKFPRLLARSGLIFRQASEMFDICGRRAAYYIDQRQAVENMSPALRGLYRHIHGELQAQYDEKASSAVR
ncbi:N-acyl amino acid synthase of PEP-CTERM/exosortase system [Kushneria sinocarnis]|uniref:N-acyl amino acid synthase of PEP-CTERM/exosortase system n=1 Tax=Kushneria sinocarnis TaxID=595502 RepID=A0A420WXA6_9GAMM|nr:PEP-CTERM/exosortase system-associated acyltransferase [Kushneria sinocarnis]RKR04389.1 N-acyl amino acid synthase of PEP-CTERM/exosortase system [Kushneria sinocarnis]